MNLIAHGGHGIDGESGSWKRVKDKRRRVAGCWFRLSFPIYRDCVLFLYSHSNLS
jgi:hypothetical protein